jgi:hypothetical protein
MFNDKTEFGFRPTAHGHQPKSLNPKLENLIATSPQRHESCTVI